MVCWEQTTVGCYESNAKLLYEAQQLHNYEQVYALDVSSSVNICVSLAIWF